MRRLKVLHVVPHMHIGGLEKVIVNLWKHLDRRLIDMSVCCELDPPPAGKQIISPG